MNNLIEYKIIEAAELQSKTLDEAIEYALRNLVDPPVTGSITSEEISKRDLRLEYEPLQVDEKPHYEDGSYVYEATQVVHMYQGNTKIF